MLSCKEASQLLSERHDRKLSTSELIHLEMHLVICKGCKNFKNQMSFIRKACERYTKKHEEDAD